MKTTKKTCLVKIPKIGMMIRGNDGMLGKIIKIEDRHNVHVKYLKKDNYGQYGTGIHCLVKKCGNRHYDPLYKVDPSTTHD
jgi:uncharacterized protein YkvS